MLGVLVVAIAVGEVIIPAWGNPSPWPDCHSAPLCLHQGFQYGQRGSTMTELSSTTRQPGAVGYVLRPDGLQDRPTRLPLPGGRAEGTAGLKPAQIDFNCPDPAACIATGRRRLCACPVCGNRKKRSFCSTNFFTQATCGRRSQELSSFDPSV